MPPARLAPPPSPIDPARGREALHFRPDIEGLRGLAILLVVVFHAAPGLLAGGFIGVDVFFVISGFLITGLLVRELDRRGRIDLGGFYVRRIRRLVPAAALALGATFLLSAWLVAPLELERVAGDGVAAALSVSNVRFALASGDYFSAVETPSPFLHYWSLSVEEQFYLVWPAMLILVFAVARGVRGVAVVIVALSVVSLAAAIVLTDTAQGWAFYSLPTRAWQLAVGGLLAVLAIERLRGRWWDGLLAVIAWLGLGAVVSSAVLLSEANAYPGMWALLPTLGAVALIAGGDRSAGPALLLRTPPMRFLGRISYALYLWHWPLLVLPTIAVAGDLEPLQTAALVGVALLVASASTIFVEEPIRRGSARSTGRRQLAVAGSLGMVLVLSVGAGLAAVTWATEDARAAMRTAGAAADGETSADDPPGEARPPRRSERRATAVDERPSRSGERAEQGSTPSEDTPAGRPAATPGMPADDRGRIGRAGRPGADGQPETPKPRQRGEAGGVKAPPVIVLPADVRPSVWEASEDEELLRDNGCLQAEEVTQPRTCQYGKAGSRFIVALVGDSHASHWFPALREVAMDRGWRLETFVKVSCPFIDMPVRNLQLKREYRECARFNANVVGALRRLRPDLVITSLSRWQHPVRSADEAVGAQGAAMARMLEQVPGRKVVLADVPYPGHDVPACLSKHPKDVRECAVPSYGRSSGGSPARERIAARQSGGRLIDLGRIICGGSGTCPVVNGKRIIFRDSHHLTATFSRWLAPALDRALAKGLKQRP